MSDPKLACPECGKHALRVCLPASIECTYNQAFEFELGDEPHIICNECGCEEFPHFDYIHESFIRAFRACELRRRRKRK